MQLVVTILGALGPFAWPLVAALALVIFRGHILAILRGLAERLQSGSGFKVGSFQMGPVATKTSEVPGVIQVRGDPDQFTFICGAKGSSWKKSTKAIDFGHGCLVQVSTESGPDSNPKSVAEALAFVPRAKIVPDTNGGAKLVLDEAIQ